MYRSRHELLRGYANRFGSCTCLSEFSISNRKARCLLEDREEDGSIELTPTRLAIRLSYFYGAVCRTRELNRWVDKNDLKEELVSYQVGRMLADARSRSLSDQFAAQWFGLRNLMEHDVDTELFPDFNPALARRNA